MENTLTMPKPLYLHRYVVKPKVTEREPTTEELLQELDRITRLVSDNWEGPRDAVAEIRYQRGGEL